jgi:hypothetical protein
MSTFFVFDSNEERRRARHRTPGAQIFSGGVYLTLKGFPIFLGLLGGAQEHCACPVRAGIGVQIHCAHATLENGNKTSTITPFFEFSGGGKLDGWRRLWIVTKRPALCDIRRTILASRPHKLAEASGASAWIA